ncbi:MAG: hypothetical protein WCC66_02745 [Rhizobiaceae bacterium]
MALLQSGPGIEENVTMLRFDSGTGMFVDPVNNLRFETNDKRILGRQPLPSAYDCPMFDDSQARVRFTRSFNLLIAGASILGLLGGAALYWKTKDFSDILFVTSAGAALALGAGVTYHFVRFGDPFQ